MSHSVAPTRLTRLARWSRALVPLFVGMSLATSGCGSAGLASGQANTTGTLGAKSEIISTVTGDSPNFAQLANGSLMTVVSRDFGRGAKAGALVEFYYPHCSTDQLWDSYVGVTANGQKLAWAHQLKLVGQAIVPDTGRVTSRFEGPGYDLLIEDVVPPGSDVHLRRATLTNTGTAPLENASLAFYAYFTLNSLPTGDRLVYQPDTGALVQSDSGVAVAVEASPRAEAGRCGTVGMPLGACEDARLAAEAGDWQGPAQAGPTLTGVNGTLRNDLGDLAPGASKSVTYAIGAGPAADRAQEVAHDAVAAGWDTAASADQNRWAAWLARAKQPTGLDATSQAVYRRALITLGQHRTDLGGFIAAPTNMDPPYRFIWPRDGSLTSLTLLQAGYAPEAEAFFTFCERLQKSDGSFAVNYFPDGSRPLWDFGPNGNEHDEPATFAWGVEQTFEATGDQAWLAARWPAVCRACEFLIKQQTPTGLLSTCRDLWELNDDGTWTYSNAAAWAGLEAGARIADREGDHDTAKRYRTAADRLHQAIESQLAPDGYFVRGIRKGRPDQTVEAANLALGSAGFGAFADSDPRLAKTAALIGERLTSPEGGIRRYENDQYYNGQPWPVATAWLAMYKLQTGDRASAARLLGVMTKYAATTDALMLGEQFDESSRRWVSAFPLAWSEAAYIRLALALGSP